MTSAPNSAKPAAPSSRGFARAVANKRSRRPGSVRNVAPCCLGNPLRSPLPPRLLPLSPPQATPRSTWLSASAPSRRRWKRAGATDGERKTITALFADLKGSTALIEGLDPEEARAIIDPALQLMMDAVHRYEGYVAQALGDGIFALFGAPIAHEDHPQRALYAALRMQEEMRRYSDQVRLKHGVAAV